MSRLSGAMWLGCCCAVVCAVGPYLAWAEPAETALGKSLRLPTKAIAAEADEHGLFKIVLVVRAGAESDPVSAAVLAEIRKELQADFEGSLVQISVVPQAEKALGDAELTPEQVQDLQTTTECDGVLTADLTQKGKSRSLELALVSDTENVCNKTVKLPNGDAEKASTAKKGRPAAALLGTGQGITGKGITGKMQGGGGGGSRSTSRTAGGGGGGGSSSAGAAAANLAAGLTGGGSTGAGAGADGPSRKAEPGSINAKIVEFAVSKLGQQVGNGECWTLAAEALKAAGAKAPRGYDFGDEVALDTLIPGDIIQFESARFEEAGLSVLMGLPNHTVVVESAAGSRIGVLQQNFNGRIVSRFDINFKNMVAGSAIGYRALP